ncbi:MAG: hypothetical protein Q4B71_03620 [Cardiobacteriaceae bacterium]|nr:hypothetical protein [Cardiobacteriaceae bacterium]
MKKFALLTLSALAGLAQAQTTVAEDKGGKILEGDQFKVVRKILKKDELMAKHDHPHHNIVITVVSGKVEFTFNDSEVIVAEAGKVLTSGSKDFIAGKGLEDSVFVVTLIHESGHHEHDAHHHTHDHNTKPSQ